MPEMFPNLKIDMLGDFVSLGLLAEQPFVIAVAPALNVNSLADLVKLSKEKPGTLNFAAGETTKTVRIELAGSSSYDYGTIESLRLNLSGATNATLGKASAMVSIVDNAHVLPTQHVTGKADLDGQWTTAASALPGNGTYTVTMTEGTSSGAALAGAPTSAPLSVTVNLGDMSFASTSGNNLQLDPGSTGAAGNWLALHVLSSNLPNGTLLAYTTDTSGHLIGRDGHTGSGVTLQDAVVASVGLVKTDGGATMFSGDQAAYLPADQQLHFAIQTGNGAVQELPNAVVSGSGTLGVQVTGNNGTLALTATVDNTLSANAALASTQRQVNDALTYLTQGSTVDVSVAGTALSARSAGRLGWPEPGRCRGRDAGLWTK